MNELQTVRNLDTVAAEIRLFTASMLGNIIEIGRRMVEAKSLLPHGEFLPWLKEQTGYSSSTANNFMRLYEEYGADQGCLFGAELNCQTFGNLNYSKALALISLPKDEREAFVLENDVEKMTTRELKEALKERDAALRRAEEAEERAQEEKECADALLQENEQLLEQVRELEKAPKEITVEQDPAAVEAAVREALEQAAADHEKEVAALKKKAADAQMEKANLEKAVKAAEERAATAKKAAEGAAAEAKAKAQGEATRWQLEAEDLRKRLAMADPVTAEFKGIFAQTAAMVGKLMELLKAAPADTAPNLKAALDALRKQIGEALG